MSKTAIFLGLIAVIVIAVKIYQGSNKILLSIGLAMVVGMIFFNWIYNRTEPAFLTPVIEPLSQFFPSKGYEKPAPTLDGNKKGTNQPRKKSP